MTWAVQRLGPHAAERARAVRRRALRDAPDAFWITADQEEATTADQWRDRLSAPDMAMFVACGNGDVGLSVGARHSRYQTDAVLTALWVAPEARGHGIAEELIQAVLAWARAAGYLRLRLDVADTNAAALRLYDKLGFTPTGGRDVFPPPRDHITEHERTLDLRLSSPSQGPAPPRGH